MSKTIPAIEFCDSIFDGTHDTPNPKDEGFPLVTSKHMTGSSLNLSDAYLIDITDYQNINKRSQVSQWDILFSMIGTVGEVYLEQNQDINYAIKNIGVFSCKDEKRAKWLFYYLKSPAAKKHIQRYLSGAVQKFLSLGALRDFPVLPFDESANDGINLVALIDKKIELNNKINTELEAMAKLIYDYWFVQFDFPDANGKPYKSSGGKMVYNEDLKREIPDGWSADYIENLLAKEARTKKLPKTQYLSDGAIPVIDQSTDFICGYTNDIDTVITTDVPRIVFGDHTRIVKLVNFDFARGADGTQVLLSNQRCVPQHFFYHSLLKIDLSNYGYARHFKFLKQTRIVIPDYEVSNQFEDKVKSFHDKIKHNIFETKKLEELKDWLLPMLMNGQVTVKDV
jgi:type I restriction enzyme, S subunit